MFKVRLKQFNDHSHLNQTGYINMNVEFDSLLPVYYLKACLNLFGTKTKSVIDTINGFVSMKYCT